MAALLSTHCRVIIHDRRNCGKSDMVIGGELSEQHLWAEEMAALLKYLGAAPAYVAGGSAGSRTSLTVAVRHPKVVKGVFVWEVSGGPRSAELMSPRLLRTVHRGRRARRYARRGRYRVFSSSASGTTLTTGNGSLPWTPRSSVLSCAAGGTGSPNPTRWET